MKRLSLLASAALALAACATSVPMGTASDDAAGKTFSPPSAGRAALYVYQAQSNVVLDITANQRLLGTLGEFSYLRTEVPPGRYELRARVNNVDAALLPLDVRAGEIRYVRATAAPQTYTLREEPASVAQPAILTAKRISEIKFLEVPY
ncbi:MAG: hypothetical protein JOY64_09175 [Alphaproteobacteria bacterium]|nr:hypothetical protein [Alphaproteobacteria bacterium]MBV8407788.1 hypothetical protein [Alphaproteobacteria bacterium]